VSRLAFDFGPTARHLDLTKIRRNPRHNPIVQEYVLPDFSPNSTSRTGYIRSGPNAAPTESEAQANGNDSAKAARKVGGTEEEEQVLWMGNERFAGPELLFNPSDIGLKQSGLPETIALVISMMPVELQGMFWAHIGVFGGLGNIPDFGERLCVYCKLDSFPQLMRQRT
jgi:actin-related protein 6